MISGVMIFATFKALVIGDILKEIKEDRGIFYSTISPLSLEPEIGY
jgi:hypothetical protein